MTKGPTKVLIVDASPIARARLRAIFALDPELLVVGEATRGEDAVALAGRLRPDVITMNAQMPKEAGFETTRRIMTEVPTPVVVVSSCSEAEAVEQSVRALHAGALSLLRMPEPTADEAAQQIFARTVKALASVKVVRRRERKEVTPSVRPERPRSKAHVVAIGGSTGGPAALRSIIEALPESFAAPILVTQHLAPGFTEDFVQWLSLTCPLRVKVAEDGEPLARGTVYVAPEQHHLRLSEHRIRLPASVPIGGFRPAISAMFESVAQGFGERVVAVMLTGMGRDGVEGLRAVRDRRGFVIAQDEESCVVFGMPKAAIESGVVDEVLSLRRIGSRLEELIRDEVNT